MRKTLLALLAFGSMALGCTNEGGLFGRGVSIGYPVSPGCDHPYYLGVVLEIEKKIFQEDGASSLRSEVWRIKTRAKPEEAVSRVIAALRKLGYTPTSSELVEDAYMVSMVNRRVAKFTIMLFFISDQGVDLVATWWQQR